MVAIIVYAPDHTIDVPLKDGVGQTATIQPLREGVPLTTGQLATGRKSQRRYARRRHSRRGSFSTTGDSDGPVHGPAGDLTVADLHVYSVQRHWSLAT